MKACIFDLDGTLFDSMGVWEQVDRSFLEKRGIPVPHDYMDAVRAMGFQEAANYTIARFHLPDSPKGLLQEWNTLAAYAYGHSVPMKPCAKEYLLALRAGGVKLAAATSLPEALYAPAFARHGLAPLFDAVCTTAGSPQGKTVPDVFLRAVKALDVPCADCVVFEDILEAVRSAKRAGMRVYGVHDAYNQAQWAEIVREADGVIYNFCDAPLP